MPLLWSLKRLQEQIMSSLSPALLLFVLSVLTSLILSVLNRVFSFLPKREALVQSLMGRRLKEISLLKSAKERQEQTTALYRRYRYHPFLALRSSVPLFLQLPFLFGAYYFLSHWPLLEGASFLVIVDLSLPDYLVGNFNALPLIMSAINVLTALLTPGFGIKEKRQAFFIAIFFFFLLYNSPSGLLIYWTTNNLIFLCKTIWKRKRNSQSQASLSIWIKIGIGKAIPYTRQYLALISLFYLYQAMALEDGFFFDRYIKFIPFLFAAFGFFITQLIGFISDKRDTQAYLFYLRLVLSAGILVLPLLIAPLFSIDMFLKALSANLFAYAFLFAAMALAPFKKEEEEPSNWMNRLSLPIILSLIPALHYARLNSDYLPGLYLPLFFLTMPLLGLLNCVFISLFASRGMDKAKSLLNSSLFTLLFFSLSFIRFGVKYSHKIDLDLWLYLFILMVFISGIEAKKKLKSILYSSLVLLFIFLGTTIFLPKASRVDRSFPKKELTEQLKSIEFKHRPNIYLFVYDAIPNQKVFEQQKLPFEAIDALLKRYDFSLYPDTFTLGQESLDSMGKMLDFTDENKSASAYRDIHNGNSWTNLILRSQGYKSYFLLDNYLTGSAVLENSELFEEIYPPRSASEAKIDYFITLLRGILQGEMRFDTKGIIRILKADIQKRKLELIKELGEKVNSADAGTFFEQQSRKTPAFVVNHCEYPGHSQNSGTCLPNETELFLQRLSIALKQMEKDFATIEKYDPKAIVIAIGDHGPYLTGDCLNLVGWKREDITEELIWDRIGTMVAIRGIDLEGIRTNQDIFPALFAALADDPSLYNLRPKPVFSGLGTRLRKPITFDAEGIKE